MAAILVYNAQAKIEVEAQNKSAVVESDQDIVSQELTAKVVTVTQDRVTHEQEKTTDTMVITVTSDHVTIRETETVEPFIAHPTSIDQLANMINDDEITTFDQLIEACKHFPELQDTAYRFLQEKITDTSTALMKFGTVKNPVAKKYIISLVTKVKNKEKLWILFRN